MVGINLLPASEKISAREIEFQRKLRQLCISSSVIYLVFVVSLFGYWFYWQQRSSRTEGDLSDAEARVINLNKNEGMFALIRKKMGVASALISAQLDYLKEWQSLVAFLGDKVVIDSLTISENGDVSLEASVADSLFLHNLEEKLKDQGSYTEANLSGVTSAKTGGYKFSLVLTKNTEEGASK